MPACGPRRGCASRPVRPIFINKAFKTLARGQASRGGRHKTSSRAASPGWLARGGEFKARQTAQGSDDVSHDDQGQADARRAPMRIVSLFPLAVELLRAEKPQRVLSVFWERGSPDLPACGPRRGWAGRSVWPIFIDKAFETLARGQASRGGRRKTSSVAASPGRLMRGGEIKARQTS